MSEYKIYIRKGDGEMKKWEGEDIKDVSISKFDSDNGSPKKGDMIARNSEDHSDTWLVAEEYFKENYIEV